MRFLSLPLLPATLLPMIFAGGPALADPAVIDAVEARKAGDSWTFSVTLSHGDTGWDDYADGWRIEDADGTVLGFRELLHPHVNEQPFTRSLSDVSVPPGMAQVHVRARTNTDGWAETTQTFDMPGD